MRHDSSRTSLWSQQMIGLSFRLRGLHQRPAVAQLDVRQHPDTMRILALIWFLAFICVCLGGPSQKQPPISKNEHVAIEAVIKKETAEKILTIKRESSDTVEVRTGTITPGRLEGKGQTFQLKRTQKGWQITKKGLWVS